MEAPVSPRQLLAPGAPGDSSNTRPAVGSQEPQVTVGWHTQSAGKKKKKQLLTKNTLPRKKKKKNTLPRKLSSRNEGKVQTFLKEFIN